MIKHIHLWLKKEGPVPNEIYSLSGLVTPSFGHAKRVVTIIRTKLWRQKCYVPGKHHLLQPTPWSGSDEQIALFQSSGAKRNRVLIAKDTAAKRHGYKNGTGEISDYGRRTNFWGLVGTLTKGPTFSLAQDVLTDEVLTINRRITIKPRRQMMMASRLCRPPNKRRPNKVFYA